MKFYPYKQGGGERKSFSHAQIFVEVVLTRVFDILAIPMRGVQQISPL